MPKRITRRERWRRKTFEALNPPELRAVHRAMYNPHFTRAFRTWSQCQRTSIGVWCDFAEQCLDRTEII